jgi:hypothetical protein
MRALWNSCKISLSASLQYPNKLYGKIDIKPTSSFDLIDHFELYIDDIAQQVNISPKDLQFSAIGFAGGEQYEVNIVAYPKNDIADAEPISSNKRVILFFLRNLIIIFFFNRHLKLDEKLKMVRH